MACSDTDECAAQTNPCGGNWNNLILFELLAHIDEYLAANAGSEKMKRKPRPIPELRGDPN